MFFREVAGQQLVKEKLLDSVQRNRVSHTQLFLGPEGSGALALALAFAQYINCENRTSDDSCGKCASCIKSQKMIHPDIHYSFPAFKKYSGSENPALSKDFIKEWREAVLENPYLNLNDWLSFINAENKQGTISADECRDIIHTMNLKTFESAHKVIIIWRPEFFSQGGKIGNTLLKLLEEPPNNSLIILIAEEREQLLPTIVSRCQIVSVPRIDDEALLEALLEKHSLHREAALKILRHTEGNYREVQLKIANTEDDQVDLLNRWMRLIYDSGKAKELSGWIDEVARTGREKQKTFLKYTMEFFRECIMLQKAGEGYSKLRDEEKKMALWFSGKMDSEDWVLIIHRLEEAHYHIERNAHPKILFMNLSLQLQQLVASKKVTSPAN